MKSWGIMLLTLLLAASAIKGSEGLTIDEDYIQSMVLNLDLVVEGDVRSVEAIKIPSDEIYGYAGLGGFTIITRLQVDIVEVMAGEYSGGSVSAYLLEGRIGEESSQKGGNPLPCVAAGDRIIIGLHHNLMGYGRYVLLEDRAFFKISGDKLIPYEPGYTVGADEPIRLIREASKKREFKYLISSSDHICVGTLLHKDEESGTARIKVDERYKGDYSGEEIVLDYDYNYAINSKNAGDRLLLFLDEGVGKYHLSSGMNSVYLVEDGTLKRDKTVLSTNLKQVKDRVQIVKEEE